MKIPRLHPDTIEEVKAKVDIIDVVGEHVVLKKRGKDYLGNCPFHQEKSPSFSVSPTKQMYYCFGCQAGGNAINFMMELGKQSFTEVVLDLARRYQVPVQTLEPEQRQELQRRLSQREQLYEILAITASFYQHALNQPQGEKALNYLKIDRGFSTETIQGFKLGYSPSGWETLSNYLVEQKHFSPQSIIAAGLIIPRKDETSYYDRFRDRLMIPILDLRGRVIGFGGRTLSDEQPKYLNSPETELFDKGNTLYGLDRAKDSISKTDRAVVVEGYFDVIALHAVGVTSAVAALGTALSSAQVKQLVKFTESKQIILNFDADKAGNIAAERAIGEVTDLAYQGQLQLRILNLPTGKDADEFLKNNSPADYISLLDNAPLWLDWQLGKAIAGQDLTQAEQYQAATQKIIRLLQNITDVTTRIHYLQKSAGLLSAGDARMIPLLFENLQTAIKGLKPLPEVRSAASNLPVNKFSKSNQSQYSAPDSLEDNELIELETGNRVKGSQTNIYFNQRLIATEEMLLRFYLYCPTFRLTIIDELSSADLEFQTEHHAFLWDKMIKFSSGEYNTSHEQGVTDYLDSQLVVKIQEFIVEYPIESDRLKHLFHLDELTTLQLQRPLHSIQKAITALKLSAREQEKRDYLNKLKSNQPEDLLKKVEYNDKLKENNRQKKELEEQRNYTIFDSIYYGE